MRTLLYCGDFSIYPISKMSTFHSNCCCMAKFSFSILELLHKAYVLASLNLLIERVCLMKHINSFIGSYHLIINWLTSTYVIDYQLKWLLFKHKVQYISKRVYTVGALAQCSMEHCASARIHISTYGYRWHRHKVPSVIPQNAFAHFLTSCAR